MNSLCGVVHDKMGYDVRLGDVFIFINRQRTTMKPFTCFFLFYQNYFNSIKVAHISFIY
ncbi:hypothetical protein NXX87_21030 [Bacteroides faecis]|nr:hypothetical protein NXW26_21040 [Bacteroides faecis]UVS37234.1 hypothetical protein NXX87_21030 [Bacteroides faecis]